MVEGSDGPDLPGLVGVEPPSYGGASPALGSMFLVHDNRPAQDAVGAVQGKAGVIEHVPDLVLARQEAELSAEVADLELVVSASGRARARVDLKNKNETTLRDPEATDKPRKVVSFMSHSLKVNSGSLKKFCCTTRNKKGFTKPLY